MSLSGATIFSAVTSIFGDWLSSRRQIKQAKTEAKIERLKNTSDQRGWKDEYLVLLWSLPSIMNFIPGLQPYAEQGFENMANAPEWYIYGWLGITGAVFGLNRLIKWKIKDG